EPYPRMTWLTRLLPYIEQEAMWRATVGAYDFQPSPVVNPPHVGYATPIPVYSCPSDPRTQAPQDTHRGRRVALTSYVGVLGTDYSQSDGLLYADSQVRLTQVTDGTSNTLAVGERPPSADCWYGW